MKASEIRQKSASELNEMLIKLRKRQFDLRMQLGTGQLGASHEIRQVRRDIARVKTVMNMSQGENS
ncbi:MAG: 50S ribosomal protein L29 [Wenzhouxiangellaceae bacterium]